jgi:hypothetical protein
MQARGTHVRQPQLGQKPLVAGPGGSDEADGSARFLPRHGLVLHHRRRRPAHPQPRRVHGGCSVGGGSDDARRLLCGGELAAESIAGIRELGQLPLRVCAQGCLLQIAGCSELGQAPLGVRAQSRLALVAFGQLPLGIRAQSHFALVAGFSELGQLLVVLGRLPLRIRAQSRLALVARCTEIGHSSLGVREISASRSEFGLLPLGVCAQSRLARVAGCSELGQLLLVLLRLLQLLLPLARRRQLLGAR